jgi:hypothetical protein
MDALLELPAFRSTSLANFRVAQLAAQQHGVVSRRQLAAIDVDARAIRRRLGDGRLFAVLPNVFALHPAPWHRSTRWMAAVLACGPGAALTGVSAAVCHGIWRGNAPAIDVISPTPRHPVPGVSVHRVRRQDGVVSALVDGIPVTTVPQTIFECGRRLTVHQLTNVVHEALFRTNVDVAQVRACARGQAGRHELPTVHRAIDLYEAGGVGTKSPLEDAWIALLELAGIPEPWVNRRVAVDGRRYELDTCWAERRISVEVDGRGHMRVAPRLADAELDAALARAGWRSFRLRHRDIERGAPEVIRELRALLA